MEGIEMDHLQNAEELIKQAWDEYLFQKHSSEFIKWYRAGVEELSTKESGQQNGN